GHGAGDGHGHGVESTDAEGVDEPAGAGPGVRGNGGAWCGSFVYDRLEEPAPDSPAQSRDDQYGDGRDEADAVGRYVDQQEVHEDRQGYQVVPTLAQHVARSEERRVGK